MYIHTKYTQNGNEKKELLSLYVKLMCLKKKINAYIYNWYNREKISLTVIHPLI